MAVFPSAVCDLFDIEYPLVQGGMVWASGWRLASAVSNAGGLGLLGAGSMHPDTLAEHIDKCRAATAKPFGVNVPLLYPQIDSLMALLLQKKVPIVFAFCGQPCSMDAKIKGPGRAGCSCGKFGKICCKSTGCWSRCRGGRRL